MDASSESVAVADTRCPECYGQVEVGDEELLLAQIIVCDGCDVELEVAGLRPLLLVLAPEVEEDWGE